MSEVEKLNSSSVAESADQPCGLTETQHSAGNGVIPAYVREALRGLTPKQKQLVIDGAIHGDFTMATVRALRSRALFYLHIDSPNGRCGFMRLTPLGETVRGILKSRSDATSHCRRCVDCEGEEHHWMYVGDEDASGEPVMSCKHCDATRPVGDDDE